MAFSRSRKVELCEVRDKVSTFGHLQVLSPHILPLGFLIQKVLSLPLLGPPCMELAGDFTWICGAPAVLIIRVLREGRI